MSSTSTPWKACGNDADAFAASKEVGSLALAKRGFERREAIPALVITGEYASWWLELHLDTTHLVFAIVQSRVIDATHSGNLEPSRSRKNTCLPCCVSSPRNSEAYQ